MNKYLSTLILISLIGGIVNSLTNSYGNLKKYINYFLSIMMVICMISPFTNALENMNNVKENISSFFNEISNNDTLNGKNEIIINTGTNAIINGIKNTLIEKFEFDEKDIIVELETNTTNLEAIKITKIKITLTGKASWSDVEMVEKYLKNIIGGDISVIRR